jgi:hypothetical protein
MTSLKYILIDQGIFGLTSGLLSIRLCFIEMDALANIIFHQPGVGW